MTYCKRLIEVDLPIKQISEFARSEKNIRSGHPWHLHIWWARRPWGACRAVTLASLLPDPCDPLCPDEFIKKAKIILEPLGYIAPSDSGEDCRRILLNFIAHFSQWEKGADRLYLNAAKELIRAYYPTKPVVFDSFAGNGAIPGEALRLGCESIALDLNPVAILILKTLLEAIPKHGKTLLAKYREGAKFIREEAQKRLSKYYPNKNGKTPIAWLWARTVTCEGPGCGATIPLISQTTIAKGNRKAWIEVSGNKQDKSIDIRIKKGDSIPQNLLKTAGGGNAVCPVCDFTTPKSSVKRQGKEGKMGHRLFGVAVALGERAGKDYYDADTDDQKAFVNAVRNWNNLKDSDKFKELNEKYPYHDPRAFTAGLYGISKWGDLFSERQKLGIYFIRESLDSFYHKLKKEGIDEVILKSIRASLSLAISNSITYWTNLSYWGQDHMNYTYMGMGIAMRWDWAEGNPLVMGYAGGLDYNFVQAEIAINKILDIYSSTGNVILGNAMKVPLPDDCLNLYFTDPPYYDVVPYADLSDLCYVWLKRFLKEEYPDLFENNLTPKKDQILVNPYAPEDGRGEQTSETYQTKMTQAFCEGRRCLRPDGVGAIVFAHKTTEGWESILNSIINAGFAVTASWPIDTERASRMRANKSAALASSIHIVVRPRENPDGSLITDYVGDWRDVLNELPRKIHEWLPRLSEEGIVGADAIFSCLGPALEIFSKYSHVEKANGEKVELKKYLEYVWAAVAKEALNMIFEGAQTEGFEENARLTAMWLWTLSTEKNGNGHNVSEEEKTTSEGYTLPFDAARKIAQGLGVHLETHVSLLEIKSDKARLLPVTERIKFLFGKESTSVTNVKVKDSQKQLNLFEELGFVEDQSWSLQDEKSSIGKTILDRLHQAMILFAAGRNEALKRFIIEEGVGNDNRFWRLAQALSALYPSTTDEKRWVDGILAKKKSFGF